MKKIIAIVLALTMSLSMLAVMSFAAPELPELPELPPEIADVAGDASDAIASATGEVHKTFVNNVVKELESKLVGNGELPGVPFDSLTSDIDYALDNEDKVEAAKEVKDAVTLWLDQRLIGDGWDYVSLKAVAKYQFNKGFLTTNEIHYTKLALNNYLAEYDTDDYRESYEEEIKNCKSALTKLTTKEQFTAGERDIVRDAFSEYSSKMGGAVIDEWSTKVDAKLTAQEALSTVAYNEFLKELKAREDAAAKDENVSVNSPDVKITLSTAAKEIVLATNGEEIVKILSANGVKGKQYNGTVGALFDNYVIDGAQLTKAVDHIKTLDTNAPDDTKKDPVESLKDIFNGIFGGNKDEEPTDPENPTEPVDPEDPDNSDAAGEDDEINSNSNGDLTVFAIAGTAAVAGVALLATRKKEEDAE